MGSRGLSPTSLPVIWFTFPCLVEFYLFDAYYQFSASSQRPGGNDLLHFLDHEFDGGVPREGIIDALLAELLCIWLKKRHPLDHLIAVCASTQVLGPPVQMLYCISSL